MREVQLLADLAVREAPGRELRDLQLLWCEVVERVRRSAPARLTGGAQFLPRPLGPRGRGPAHRTHRGLLATARATPPLGVVDEATSHRPAGAGRGPAASASGRRRGRPGRDPQPRRPPPGPPGRDAARSEATETASWWRASRVRPRWDGRRRSWPLPTAASARSATAQPCPTGWNDGSEGSFNRRRCENASS